jgi:putative nucleotidyltransferase with HDIG domain
MRKKLSLMGPFIAIILPYLFFEILRQELIFDPVFNMPSGHFYIVSAVAILAFFISISIGMVANKLRNIKITFLSLSFISLAQMFSVHGLSTPHFLLEPTHLPGVAAQLSMVLATVWLWLSSLPTDHKLIVVFSKNMKFLLPLWILVLSVFAVISMLHPQVVDFIPLTVKPLNWLLMLATVSLNLVTMLRYFHGYRYSRFPLQLSIVYSSGWLIVSQLIMVLGEQWKLSWWTYHFLLLASMIVVLVGLYKQYVEKGTMVTALKSLFISNPFEQITASITPSVKELVVATEKKDTYTAGHTFRVTIYALKLAEELGLEPEVLRAISQGTLLHDVGKIKVPDTILNKPGKLSLEERQVIENHPLLGYEMSRGLGILSEELSIIRSHHEKWDGTGYPDKLKGEKIPFLARIVAVADVYDALTSDRSYRKAWTHQEAMKFITEQKGSHFDPLCVDAWVKLCERDPSVYLYPNQTIRDDTTGTLVSTI